MRRDFVGRAMSFGKTARSVQRLISAELHGRVPVPFGKRLWGWRHGFTGESTARYRLTRESVHDYVSDVARYIRTPRINGPFASALHNKLVFSEVVASHGGPVPEYHCFAGDHMLVPIGDRYDMRDADGIIAACMTGERFIVKPIGGGGGVSVRVISSADGRLTINGKVVDKSEFRGFIEGLSDALICEFIVQHDYATTIFPDSTNSIRILSMWDYEKDEPFLPFAGHKFGRPPSIPIDNVAQGGILFQVDVASGELTSAAMTARSRGTVWLDQHPDTGAQVKGVRVPNWGIVTTGLVELARRMSYIPYVGWDVVVTADGFSVIEGNSHPDLMHQIIEPLLRDARVRAFYERFRII